MDVWFYADATQFTFGDFASNITGLVRGEMNAEYRRQIVAWTKAAFIPKVQAGHAVGGRVFGFDNIKVDGHVEQGSAPSAVLGGFTSPLSIHVQPVTGRAARVSGVTGSWSARHRHGRGVAQ